MLGYHYFQYAISNMMFASTEHRKRKDFDSSKIKLSSIVTNELREKDLLSYLR